MRERRTTTAFDRTASGKQGERLWDSKFAFWLDFAIIALIGFGVAISGMIDGTVS